MKIKITTVICFVVLKCFSQNPPQKKGPMEKFDIKKFQSLKLNKRDIDISKDGSIATYSESHAGFQITSTHPNTRLMTMKEYYHDNLSLNLVRHFFGRMPVGIEYVYDHSGKLINEIDYDAPFKFSFNDVTNKIKEKYKTDITQPGAGEIYRDASNLNSPYYDVSIVKNDIKTRIRIDGNTGEIIGEYPVVLVK